MKTDLYTKKIRQLSLALMLSGALNIVILAFFLYWVLIERPPTPYFELKPAEIEQQQISLADQRGFSELIAQFRPLSFSQLIHSLSHPQIVEDGYSERDLALAYLITFHHFDIQRALPKNAQPQQVRTLSLKLNEKEPLSLTVYPDLTNEQFDSLIQFARTERWPLTPEGLFHELKRQKERNEIHENLAETFILLPEFWTVDLLFNRANQSFPKQELLNLLLEGDWNLLKQFVDQQRQLQDLSDAKRQKFLLDYLKAGSSTAAVALIKIEEDFSTKKLEDQYVISILQLLPSHFVEGKKFAKEMLISPRSTNVRKLASHWLYVHANENVPEEWNYEKALARFAPEKQAKKEVLLKSPEVKNLPKIVKKETKASVPVVVKKQPNKPVPSPTTVKNDKKIVAQNDKNGVKKAPQPMTYKIQEGDSLWKIANRFGVKIEDLRKLNRLTSDALKPGTVIKIPPKLQPKSKPK